MPPVIIDLAEQFRANIVASEDAVLMQMARSWLEVESRLTAQLSALVAEVQASPNPPTPAQLRNMRRYRELLRQVASELSNYAGLVESSTENRTLQAATLGWEHANVLQSTAISTIPGVAVQFDRLPVPATEYLTAFTQTGSPLQATLLDASGAGVDAMARELIAGLALGRNPKDIARRAMRQGLGQSFTRMQTIARTEVLRSYRAATLDNYRQSRVTRGYRRVASKSVRTCIACLAVDGREYALDVPFEEHPNGRCLAIPVIIGRPYRDILTGPEWFDTQDNATQLQMMGPERHELWKSGRVTWDNLAYLHENETWGNSWQVTPVYRLQEMAT